MKVLVACEFSGIVRGAFHARGHDAWSCDLRPTEESFHWHHLRRDVRHYLTKNQKWDLMIAHPPCTYLAVSGARWFKDRQREQAEALDFVRTLLGAPVPRIALENPISVISSRIRKPDQIVHPWQFWAGEPGKGEVKATCLWLKNLPKLVPTTPNETGRIARVWRMGPGPNRSADRARTNPGLALAMAEQWGAHA